MASVCCVLSLAAAAAAPRTVSFTRIAPPAEDREAIALTGEENPGEEIWEQMEGAHSLMLVRNVARPALTPFVPPVAARTGAAMIVAPGGGFLFLAMEREGYSVARWLNTQGITAFVLKYRVQTTTQDSAALKALMLDRGPESQKRRIAAINLARQDALAAVRYVRKHADRWGLSPDRIGLMGFSAGAITTAAAVSMSDETADTASRPDAVALLYGRLPKDTVIPAGVPPAFIAAASDDAIVTPAETLALYTAWRSVNAPVELHLFENGGHGFGLLVQNKASDQWWITFERWLRLRGFKQESR